MKANWKGLKTGEYIHIVSLLSYVYIQPVLSPFCIMKVNWKGPETGEYIGVNMIVSLHNAKGA